MIAAGLMSCVVPPIQAGVDDHSAVRHVADAWAERIEKAVGVVLDEGLRTADIAYAGTRKVSTSEMGDAVLAAFKAQA